MISHIVRFVNFAVALTTGWFGTKGLSSKILG